MKENVVLVNEQDQVLGEMEKLQAHENGLLHRAFSVFLFNKSGDMLLQRRAEGKYHSPGQWTNACCSHPRKDESYLQGANRRLREELGIETDLREKFSFIYKADVGQNLWEHELDHVFTGLYDGEFNLNADEVSEVKFINLSELEMDMQKNPADYTEWFKIILDEYKHHLD